MILILLLCVGSILYTGAYGGSNPAVEALNVAVSPLQKGLSCVTNSVTHAVS